MVLAFDYIGWLIVFVFGLCMVAFTSAMYVPKFAGRRRPGQIAKWRGAMFAAAIGTLLAGLRRFVVHK